MVFTNVALKSADQLRQRVAWALSQIFVIGKEGGEPIEEWVNYYDIFIRHAFGNLKDVLKLENLYTWHFIWSKFYYFNKHYGKLLSLIYFTPILIRILFRMSVYKLIESNKFTKYYCRWDGLKSSILNKKSLMRLDKIPTNL